MINDYINLSKVLVEVELSNEVNKQLLTLENVEGSNNIIATCKNIIINDYDNINDDDIEEIKIIGYEVADNDYFEYDDIKNLAIDEIEIINKSIERHDIELVNLVYRTDGIACISWDMAYTHIQCTLEEYGLRCIGSMDPELYRELENSHNLSHFNFISYANDVIEVNGYTYIDGGVLECECQ